MQGVTPLEYAAFRGFNMLGRGFRGAGARVACQFQAIDEMRHHQAYTEFVRQIFKIDPSEMMLAFQYMMKHKIVMPAMHLRESFGAKGSLFDDFSTVAQRVGVYTGFDYVDILKKLNETWEIDKITGLTPEAEKARDYLMKLPDRMYRITERIVVPDTKFEFKWMIPS